MLSNIYCVNKKPPKVGLYKIRTSNTISTIWEYLGRFKSPSYTKNLLKKQISLNSHNSLSTRLINLKSEHVTYLIKQSEEYFLSASQSKTSIKPLLIFYGIIGLAKSLILFSDNKYHLNTNKLNNEREAHGLNWRAHFNNKDQKGRRNKLSVVNEFCVVTKRKGVYQAFRSCYCRQGIPKETLITVKQLLSLIGENWQRYYEFFNETPCVYKSKGYINGDADTVGDSKQKILGFEDPYKLFANRNIKELFPEINNNYLITKDGAYLSKKGATYLDDLIIFTDTQQLDTFALIQPFPDFKLTEFDVYYLIFFILSNLCRYRQDKWYKIVHNEDKLSEFFLIENLFDLVQYKFPLLILRELERKEYIFVS